MGHTVIFFMFFAIPLIRLNKPRGTRGTVHTCGTFENVVHKEYMTSVSVKTWP